MSAIIGNNIQLKEILKATGYDCPAGLEGKTFNEATSGGEDKLLCYKRYVGHGYNFVVYTDKPASAINYGDVTGIVNQTLPADEGKHLFLTASGFAQFVDDTTSLCQLVYEDGTKISLKDKFKEV